MKKSMIRFGALAVCVLLLSGCVNPTKHLTSVVENGSSDVLESTEVETNGEDAKDGQNQTAGASQIGTNNQLPTVNIGKTEIDLTKMGKDMVYATVYQLMVNPDSYEGKTIHLKGTYYVAWVEENQKYYHYAIIADAVGCCSQGMEFVWGDGSHVYPDEYPAEDTEVEITGVFETYQEPGDFNLYCRLADAKLVVK